MYQVEVVCADALEWLAAQGENSLDAIVTDPPYGLEFMGKEWDKPGNLMHDHTDHTLKSAGRQAMKFKTATPRFHAGQTYQEWTERWGKLALRALKPGGYLLAFGGTRTFHRLACGLEDAGFEIGDSIRHIGSLTWIYGSGFPKSLDVSKEFDWRAFREWLTEHRPQAKRFARRLWKCTEDDQSAWRWCRIAEAKWGEIVGKRKVVGHYESPEGTTGIKSLDGGFGCGDMSKRPVTAPATALAREWSGYGTALKPAHEPIVVARKPLEGNVCDNVEQHGVGCLNVEGCRVATGEVDDYGRSPNRADGSKNCWGHAKGDSWQAINGDAWEAPKQGRWPPNLVISHLPGCRRAGTKRVRGIIKSYARNEDATVGIFSFPTPPGSKMTGYAGADGLETVASWECAAGCPVAALDRQSGERPGSHDEIRLTPALGMFGADKYSGRQLGINDSGCASRFFPQFGWGEMEKEKSDE